MIARSRPSRGQVLVLVALFIFVLICGAALAIDIGRAYGVRARLNAAADAASFEAARALGQGSDGGLMAAKASEVALAYFRANFPSEYLGAIAEDPVVRAEHDGTTGAWKVSVEATAAMNTIFATIAGFRNLNIRASSESQRRSLDMVLVLDTSLSLELSHDFDSVKRNAQDYVNLFSETDDRLGLVAFSNGAAPLVSVCDQLDTPQNPGNDLRCGRGFKKERVKGSISALVPVNATDSEQGLKQAMDQLNSLASEVRSSTRAIVFFSDGSPNTINGMFAMASGGTVTGNLYSGITEGDIPQQIFDPTKYDGGQINGGAVPVFPLPANGTDASGTVPFESYNKIRSLTGRTTTPQEVQCDVNRAARNMVENVANQARSQGIVVFTLGLGAKLKDLELTWCGYSERQENGENILKRLANTVDSDTYNRAQPTGMYCYAKTAQDLKPCFDRIASMILRITR